MRKTALYIKWKVTGRIELFVNLGKLYSVYNSEDLGVSRNTLSKKDLYSGYSNEYIEMYKMVIR
jgi:hypothetical protein